MTTTTQTLNGNIHSHTNVHSLGHANEWIYSGILILKAKIHLTFHFTGAVDKYSGDTFWCTTIYELQFGQCTGHK